MKITVLDAETTLHSERDNDKASPHDPNNDIVHMGVFTIKDGKESGYRYYSSNLTSTIHSIVSMTHMLVGANIKFDIRYLRKHMPDDVWLRWLKTGGQVWDIQLAEYILTGQTSKMASLDKMSIKYGLPVKDDRMKEYWNACISTEDIPDEEILPYLEQDVMNTKAIFEAQVKEAHANGMLPLIRTQMDALLAIEEMEKNGMYIDEDKLLAMKEETENDLEDLRVELIKKCTMLLDKEVVKQFNLNSSIHLAHLIYGTPLTLKVKEDTGELYKSGLKKGLPKFKTITKTYKHNKGTELDYDTTPSGKIKVDSNTIKYIINNSTNIDIVSICKLLAEYKDKEKELSTYIKPILNLRWGHDGCIHHTLNQCLTSTGRLSSSKPNLQNVPREGTAGIKDAFTSRYKDKGCIIEIDFSQLEVIGLAHLSQDAQLLYDVSHGVDMHLENAATLFGIDKKDVTKEQRRLAKVGTFQLQYGAGATTICAQSDLTLEQAKALVEAYYSRYPDIKSLHDAIAKEVKATRKSTGKITDEGVPYGEGYYTSETGRKYIFREYDAPDWLKARGQLTGFSPTEMKNYPVQGFATGDIVPLMLGKVLKNVMVHYPTVKFINTVHDSLLFDCPTSIRADFIHDVSAELDRVNEHLLNIFGIEVSVPFGFDVEYGSSWGNKE